MPEKITDKVPKGLTIENGSFLGEKASCFKVDCPKEGYLFSGRSRGDTRLFPLGCPGADQAAMPLEMHFVFGPELDIGIVYQLVVFFLNASCSRGSAS